MCIRYSTTVSTLGCDGGSQRKREDPPQADWEQERVFLKKYLLVFYSTVAGLSCGMWDLQSPLQHAGSLVVAHKLLVAACGIQFPDQGLNPGFLHWKLEVLATEPPARSHKKPCGHLSLHLPLCVYVCACAHACVSSVTSDS